MFKILNKQLIANGVKRMDLKAETIARRARVGQFVMLMADERSARLAFPILEADARKGTVSIAFEETNVSTKRLGNLQIGDSVPMVVGPLGMPMSFNDVRKGNFIACVGYGLGIAQVLPVCRELKRLEYRVLGIIGAKTKRSLLLENQMRLTCDQIMITTDDGTHERKGFVTGSLREMMSHYRIKLVVCSAPVMIAQAVAQVTKEKSIRTLVSLNTLMVDGTGMCGSCRVKVGGHNVLTCVDGPTFDAHEVDYKDLTVRTQHYQIQETWHNPSSLSNLRSEESSTLTRWLGDFLKSKP